MARAFQCDDCGSMFPRDPDNHIEVSGQGFTTRAHVELCHKCAVMRFDGLVEFDTDQIDPEVVSDE
jgi:hypothetical protein